jgi:hypothetical protein
VINWLATVATIMLIAVSDIGSTVGPNDKEVASVGTVLATCFKQQATALDDYVSGADVIAAAVIGACNEPIAALERFMQRHAVSTAQATKGLKPKEQDQLADTLLKQVPQRVQQFSRDTALRAVLIGRRKANNAPNP